MEDYRTAPIEAEVRQLLSFAEKMARDASQVTHGDIETLRAAGFSDRAILDAAHVTGFFSYMNRMAPLDQFNSGSTANGFFREDRFPKF